MRCAGSILYIATACRIDVCYAAQKVAQNVARCTTHTVNSAKRVMQYLKGTRLDGLEYSPEREAHFVETYGPIAQEAGKSLGAVVAFADSDYAGDAETYRSTSGSVICYRGFPVSWKSARQTVKARSTCEAEYIALYDTIRLLEQNASHVRAFTRDPEVIFTDNKSAIDLSRLTVVSKRSKHIDIRYHEVRQHKDIICHVPTELNLADPLTKPVSVATSGLVVVPPEGSVYAIRATPSVSDADDDAECDEHDANALRRLTNDELTRRGDGLRALEAVDSDLSSSWETSSSLELLPKRMKK